MAQWTFKTSPSEMREEELLDELTDILSFDSPEPDIDFDALDHVMAILDEKYPLSFALPSAEELLVDFYKKHGHAHTNP